MDVIGVPLGTKTAVGRVGRPPSDTGFITVPRPEFI